MREKHLVYISLYYLWTSRCTNNPCVFFDYLALLKWYSLTLSSIISFILTKAIERELLNITSSMQRRQQRTRQQLETSLLYSYLTLRADNSTRYPSNHLLGSKSQQSKLLKTYQEYHVNKYKLQHVRCL